MINICTDGNMRTQYTMLSGVIHLIGHTMISQFIMKINEVNFGGKNTTELKAQVNQMNWFPNFG